MTPERWNRTTLPLGSYRFEACTPAHRRSSGHWNVEGSANIRKHRWKDYLDDGLTNMTTTHLHTPQTKHGVQLIIHLLKHIYDKIYTKKETYSGTCCFMQNRDTVIGWLRVNRWGQLILLQVRDTISSFLSTMFQCIFTL